MKQKTPPQGTDLKLRSLTSLNQDEYDSLLSVFTAEVEHKQALYTLKGAHRRRLSFGEQKNSSLFGAKRKLDFILMYMKENPNQAYHGYCFGLSQAKVSEWVYFLSPVVESSLTKMGYMPQTGDSYHCQKEQADYFLVDVTERSVPRRSDLAAQKEEYSGKKKDHTVKNLALTDPDSYILFLSDSYEGRTHDKAVWNDLEITPSDQTLLLDLGFLGVEKTHPNAIIPYKKPKKKELTDEQKQFNSLLASLRVRVEHAFSGVKRLKIIREKIRLKSYNMRDLMMRIAAAMHNFRSRFRKPLVNQS